jgi:HEAT repeat protein
MTRPRPAAPDPVGRAAAIAALGHGTDLTAEQTGRAVRGAADDDPRVRAAAIGALVRGAPRDVARAAWHDAIVDATPSVRRRAAELAPALDAPGCLTGLVLALADPDVTVVEAAAWALGETPAGVAVAPDVVDALSHVATDHHDALAREAAVAALGSIGDAGALPAILHATGDRPAVRRRAVLALAPFDGPDVDAALQAALDDKDWQVRQAAEDLTRT